MGLRTTGVTLLVLALGPTACGSSSKSPGAPADGGGGDSSSGGGSSSGSSSGSGSGSGSSSGSGGGSSSSSGGDGGGSTTGGLHVVMGTGGSPGHIVDGSGKTVQLHGADRSGTEYACLNGGFFDGPVDQAAVDAMKSWNINAVRVPLNEDCWLGINGVAAAYGGANYQNAIATWVNLLTQNGMVVILDLHWTAPGTTPGQRAGADGRRRSRADVLVAGRRGLQGQRHRHLRPLQRAVHHRLGLLDERRLVRAARRRELRRRRHGVAPPGGAQSRSRERRHPGGPRLLERHVASGSRR